jgi:hypothetical protein
VHKPVRMRDAGGISPPVKHKARRAKEGASITCHMSQMSRCAHTYTLNIHTYTHTHIHTYTHQTTLRTSLPLIGRKHEGERDRESG